MLFTITCDYEAFGPSGRTFQVMEVQAEDGTDYSFLISPEKPYFNHREVKEDIAKQLQVEVDEVELEEI